MYEERLEKYTKRGRVPAHNSRVKRVLVKLTPSQTDRHIRPLASSLWPTVNNEAPECPAFLAESARGVEDKTSDGLSGK